MRNLVLVTGLLLGAAPLLAAEAHPGCNQLGREIALRAAERMQAGLDAAARAELALIAEEACVEFAAPQAAAAQPGVVPPAVAATEADGESGQEPRRLFGLDIIPPEDRVRRAAMKRP